jgi:Fe-S oxidoreductase
MGWIFWWSRLASATPSLANFFSQTNPFAGWMKMLMGVAPERKIPRFAGRTFRDWFLSRKTSLKTGAPHVLLWIDTFHNFYYPEIAQASVEALESLGFRVVIPSRILCCGRPLYEYGMLGRAKKVLSQTINNLRSEFTDDVPMVGLEPGCLSVFRDEMANLFPGDAAVEKLRARTFLLSEFLDKQDVALPSLHRKALVHFHCHQRSIMGVKTEEAILKKLGLEFETLDSGCCGMAGSFGFEKDHYDVSIRCAERVLAPAIRQASEDTLILTNGFSCREQILQSTRKRPLHLGEVLKMALRPGP